jgi:O-antigen/teichoic acid export membrane protein
MFFHPVHNIPHAEAADPTPGPLKSILVSFIIIIVSYLVNYRLNVILARWFGPKTYGDYSTVIYSLQVMAMALSVGVDYAMVKFLPQYLSVKNWNNAAGYLRFSLKLLTRNNLIIFSVGIVLAVVLYVLNKLELLQFSDHHPVFLFFWIVPFVATTTFLGKYLRSMQQVFLSILSLNLAQPVITLALFTCVLLADSSLTLFEAVFIYLIAIALVIIVQFSASYRKVPAQLISATPNYESNKWLKTAVELVTINFLTSNMFSIAIILARAFDANKEHAGILAAVSTVCTTMWLIYNAVNMVISPLIGPAMIRQDKQRLKFLMHVGNLSMFIVGLGVLMLCVFYGKKILAHFGPDFVTTGYVPLITFATVFLFTLSFGSYTRLIQYSRKRKPLLKITAILLVLYIVATCIATKHFSLIGTVTTFACMQVIITLVYISMAWQFFREKA